MGIKHGLYLVEICPICKTNKKTKGARACWDCRYRVTRSEPKYCLRCNAKLTKHNWKKSDKEDSYNVCRDCSNAESRRKYQNRKEWYASRHNLFKEKVIQHYGGKCACCSIDDQVFLTLDHVNNNGAEHRRSLGGTSKRTGQRYTGNRMYKWVIENGFPDDFQILCWNCNWAKSHGGCPHQQRQQEAA